MTCALAAVIGDEDHFPEPRQPEAWLRVPHAAVCAYVRGVVFAIRYQRRRRNQPDHVLVGEVVRVEGGRVLHFHPIGCPAGCPPTLIEVSAVTGAALLPPHGWRELQLVKLRQAKGWPARELPRTSAHELRALVRQREHLLRQGRLRPITSAEKRVEP